MSNENGNIIRNTLEKIGRPATLREILEHIAYEAQVPAKELTPTVKKTLKGGVDLGYLKCKNGQYYNATDTKEGISCEEPAVGETPIDEKAKPARTNVGRTSRRKRTTVRRRRTAKPRAYARRSPQSPRILARKIKNRLTAPKKGIRKPGRPKTMKRRTRLLGRPPAMKRGIRVAQKVRILPRLIITPKRIIRTPAVKKRKTGIRRRKIEARGRPYKANVLKNRGRRQ